MRKFYFDQYKEWKKAEDENHTEETQQQQQNVYEAYKMGQQNSE